jgi:hypothetical protein
MSTSSTSSSSLVLNEEMDRLMSLCSYISQMASRIRLMHLSNISFSPDYVKLYHQELLSISENVEGSAVLLESLLIVEQRKSVSIEMKKSRYSYTREELLKLRQSVTPSLITQTKKLLDQVVERENDQSIKSGNKSWRNIRTILAS